MRTFDAGAINALCNHPSIRPTIGGEGELDCSGLIADKRNVFMLADGGGACFIWRGPGVYEGHSFFLARGSDAIRLGKAMLDELDADLVWGTTPESNRPARWFNRKIGFKSLGMIDTPDLGRCELFEKRK